MLVNSLPDIKLIRNIKKTSCNLSTIEMLRRYEKIAFKVIDNYCKKCQGFLKYDELVEDTPFLIIKAINSYNPKKSQFQTYFYNSVRFHILNLIKSKTEDKVINAENIDLVVDKSDFSYKDSYKEKNVFEYSINLLGKLEDKRIKKIYQMRFLERKNQTWREISQKLDISATWCKVLFNRGKEYLKDKIVKEYY